MTMNEAARIHFAEALTMRLKQADSRKLSWRDGCAPRASDGWASRASLYGAAVEHYHVMNLMILAIESLLSSGPGDLPSGQLAALYRAAREAPRPEASVPQVPRELPARTAEFTGRKNDLEALTGFLGIPDRPTVAVINIDGPGGIGNGAGCRSRLDGNRPVPRRTDDLRRSARQHPRTAPAQSASGAVASPAQCGRRPFRAARGPPGGFRTTDGFTATSPPAAALDNIRDATQVRHLLLGGSASAIILTSRANCLSSTA